jgi:hypothetical protein
MSEEERELEQKDESGSASPHKETNDERVSRVLESARQAVKPIVKREMEGEVVTPELFGLRLKG